MRAKHKSVKAIHTALLALLLFSLPVFAADSLANKIAQGLGSIPSQLNFSTILENKETADVLKAAEQSAGMQLPALGNASQAIGQPSGLPSEISQLPAAAANIVPVPSFAITQADIIKLAIVALVLLYIFAAGKIAEFLRMSGRGISKHEVLLVPFAYLFAAAFGILIYFASGLWVPPQSTIITMGFYFLLLPLGITIGLGAAVLHLFFQDRLNAWQSLNLSLHVILAPIFDGLSGYWASFGAAAILVFISGFTYWSSGGNFSLVTLDFLLLSSVVALYFLYRTITSPTNEGRASNLVTMLVVTAPSILRLFFKDIACALLALIPFDFFRTCPLLQAGNEVTLALSVLATLIVLIPIIPIIYALIVNLLRFAGVLQILFAPEAKAEPAKKPSKEYG